MDLSALNSTLPPGLADAERDMGDKFRAAALSITNLYKSSLSYTKQSYHVGYAACIADVLSTLHSSIAAGQDAPETLSRLMDWAEARDAAMAAFAAEEGDEPSPAGNGPSAPILRKAALAKQAIANMVNQPRSASAPVPDRGKAKSPEPAEEHHSSVASTPVSSMSSAHASHAWQATPAQLASSPSTSTTSSLPRPQLLNGNSHRKHHHSPVRSMHAPPPSSTFNPALPQLPAAGVPFVTSTNAPALPIGSKRTLVDYEMGEETAGMTRSTPSRSNKRRSLGANAVKEEGEGGEGKERDRRGRGRRGHGGAGMGM